jgi:hypothetical protein
VKILMRKTFVDSSPASNLNSGIHSLEEEATTVSLIVHNILQEVKIKQEQEQVINELGTSIFYSPTCAEIKHLVHVTCAMNELNLLSSLDTFGCIEYDIPCDLNIVEKRMFCQTKLPLLTRNNFHAIDSYDNGVFIVHRVYICSDLNPHSIMQQYDQVESDNNTNPIMSSFSTSVFKKQVHFQEGEHCCLPKISSTTIVKPKTVCFQEGENNEIMHLFATSGVYIQMSPWPPPFIMMGRQGCGDALKMTLSRGWLKCKKRRMMRTSIAWIQSHPHGAIIRHISNTVISFLCSFINYLENRLLPNNLIIVRNHGDEEEDEWDMKRVLERQGDGHIKVEIQSNSEF